MTFGPGCGQAIGALAVAAMDEQHVRNLFANLVECPPDVVAIGFRIIGGGKGQPAAGKDDRRSFGNEGSSPALGAGLHEITCIDDRRRQVLRMRRSRSRHRFPGIADLVAIERSGDLAHVLERHHARFGGLCALDLLFEVAGMHFRAVGGGEEEPDFVAGAVELARFAAGGAVKQIDEAPGDVLGIGLEGRIGK